MATNKMFIICIMTAIQSLVQVLVGGFEQQECTPRLSLIPIDSPYFNYFPYFVQLHRCGGSCSLVSPRIQKCSAASTKIVSKTFIDMSKGDKMEVLRLVNHTSCNCSCTQNPGSCDETLEIWNPESCSCRCRFTKSYPCPENFIWNQHACKCVCNRPPHICDVNKVWNKDFCGCLCNMDALMHCVKQGKQMDKESCTCYSQSSDTAARGGIGVDRDIMIGCMFAELFLLLMLFDIFLYCHYGDGVVTSLHRKFCSKRSRQEADTDVPLQKDTTENC